MIPFNVPRLMYFPVTEVVGRFKSDDPLFSDGDATIEVVHIGRTNIAGCTVECEKVTLVAGQPFSYQQPARGLCEACVRAIHALNYIKGLRA
jgi:hypothetical protein